YIYFPDRMLVATPARVSLPYEEVDLQTRDRIRLHGWFIPAPDARLTLLFLHGNAGNISHRLESLQVFHELGVNVFIFDYRGYGGSDGKPSEQGTYRDASAAWHYLTEIRGIPGSRIVLFGRSLGGALAVWLAGRTRPAALILESTFTSVRDMAARFYPYLPVSLLIRVRYPTLDRIGSLHLPILIVHSADDEIIPYACARRLYDAAPGPKVLLTLHGGHNDGFLTSGVLYRQGLADFLRRYAAPCAAGRAMC
ncbi:MAG: alpha/beta hydrolase, partial [Gammaproteobacteria bacterium]